jgi:hypothetical protein
MMMAAAEQDADRPHTAQLPAFPGHLADALNAWSPQGMPHNRWALIADAVRLSVIAFAPTTPASLGNARPIIAAFASWVLARPGRQGVEILDDEEFLTEGLIDAYLAGPMVGQPDGRRPQLSTTGKPTTCAAAGSARSPSQRT